ncbi:hypothetical protein CPHO_07080 [Corynebacterium phocae]|uniref:Uncharacterized protein n=1 Tax=Corynebacterium phocae TaxID=161895 RepID=A0A1L7D3J2_9CORY|nr:hypothetical protein CPHO_07080 [Corynebacterium phocae]KAA8723585.1 hypothetical protein F4V58_06585 [Corynebacterium phocae]
MGRQPDLWKVANKNRRLQEVLEKRARRIAARATAISRANGGKANYSVRTGIRPSGRAYADVVSDSPAEERGTEEVPRINALRRAARGQ